MRIKKAICMAAACIMALGMITGCGSNTGNGNTGSSNTGNSNTAGSSSTASNSPAQTGTENAAADNSVTENASEADSTAASGKTLVVYYSATGSTKAVAETLASTLDADLFEITPTDPYSDDDLNWTNKNSRVSKEHDDESLRDVELTQVTLDNWDSYDTVLVGYPIWWAIAAWPVDNFVKGNDFTGKTVIPFCTSASSGMGNSGKLLAEMAGTGTWQDGQRFSSVASDSDVQQWAESLNIGK